MEPETTDGSLMAAISGGDAHALSALNDRYVMLTESVSLRIVQNDFESHELRLEASWERLDETALFRRSLRNGSRYESSKTENETIADGYSIALSTGSPVSDWLKICILQNSLPTSSLESSLARH